MADDPALARRALLQRAAATSSPLYGPEATAEAAFLERMSDLWRSLPPDADRAVLLRAGLVDYLSAQGVDPGGLTMQQVVDALLEITPELTDVITRNYGTLHVEIRDRAIYEIEAARSRRPKRRAG